MHDTPSSPHVVIIGAGFGGLRAARTLRKAPVQITLLDRKNYHLFQPLLYQVATAGVSPEEIAHPVRAIFRRQKNLTFQLANVTGIDFDQRQIHSTEGSLAYDYLILAVGSESNYFGLDSVKTHGLGMKDIDEAIAIRNQVLRMFELATHETDPEIRRTLLTFVVVGGGPTGVESAGALSELIRLVLIKDYPQLNIKDVRVLLLEASDRLLTGLPEDLQEFTAQTLWKKYVEVRFGATVTDFNGERVLLKSGELIPSHTLIWAAGVRAASIVTKLDAELARQGRVIVAPTLQLPQHDRVFVIGDAAYLEDQGKPLPMVAPVAIQQAEVAAKNVISLLNEVPLKEFQYKDPGELATIGRNQAVARLGRLKFRGVFAWLVWLFVHLMQLVGFRNRLVVLINWAWDYFFYERAVRLIVPSAKWSWTPGAPPRTESEQEN